MGVTDWLSKKDKKEGGTERQGVVYEKKGGRYYHSAKISRKKNDYKNLHLEFL